MISSACVRAAKALTADVTVSASPIALADNTSLNAARNCGGKDSI